MKTRLLRPPAWAALSLLFAGAEAPLSCLGVRLQALPSATVELAEVDALAIDSAGSAIQFAPGSALAVSVDPEIEGGATFNPASLTRGADGSVRFEVFTGIEARAYTVTVQEPATGRSGSVGVAFETETTIALDAPSPASAAPGTMVTISVSGTASAARAFDGTPAIEAPEGSGVAVGGVGHAFPPSTAGFTLLADLTIDPAAPLGAVPLVVDTNGPDRANARATVFFQIGAGGDPYADDVVSVAYGAAAGFGQSRMPGVVLGPPKGGGALRQGLDVVTLGEGGSITLAFTDNRVVDGPGPDLAVFENAFAQGGDPLVRFIELARVAVSADGVDFFEFPTSIDTDFALTHPNRYAGFAGVGCVDALGTPVPPEDFACGDGSGEPGGIGGDLFDLADVGLAEARYVRITDVAGSPQDPGDAFPGGFDLDAVAALHSAPPN